MRKELVELDNYKDYLTERFVRSDDVDSVYQRAVEVVVELLGYEEQGGSHYETDTVGC